MKKVDINMEWNTIKEIAKDLGLKFVGVKKEVLVMEINNKVEELNKVEEVKEVKKPGKWHEQEGAFPYQEGDLVFITFNNYKPLIGRMALVSGPSAKKNAIKAFLINPKTGALQNTNVTLDFEGIELYIPQLPMVINN